MQNPVVVGEGKAVDDVDPVTVAKVIDSTIGDAVSDLVIKLTQAPLAVASCTCNYRRRKNWYVSLYR